MVKKLQTAEITWKEVSNQLRLEFFYVKPGKKEI
jgi:hypothetical protein